MVYNFILYYACFYTIKALMKIQKKKAKNSESTAVTVREDLAVLGTNTRTI